MTHEPDAAAQRFFASLDAREAAVRPTITEPLRSAGGGADHHDADPGVPLHWMGPPRWLYA